MDTSFEYDAPGGVIVAVLRGAVTIPQMLKAARESWRRAEGPRIRILWDMREARFDLSSGEVRELAEFAKRNAPAADLRTAFVAPQDLEFGLVRMFEVFRETPLASARAFRDVDSAMAWLGEPDELTAASAPPSPGSQRRGV